MEFPVDLPPNFLEKAHELQILAKDVQESFIRGSGHGGQRVNKTSSTVQLKHEPTGIEARSQRFREQSKNRLDAWKLLILKIEEQIKGKESELARERYKIKKQKKRRSQRAKEKMLSDKHHRATIKEERQSHPFI
jgi:protein subunit release factor B